VSGCVDEKAHPFLPPANTVRDDMPGNSADAPGTADHRRDRQQERAQTAESDNMELHMDDAVKVALTS